ncbi:glycoside hydrolase family 18 protein [Aureibaculum algae]|uniref:chitinase n=1 Tax=Aureibaculum algae TaxID=2584122 RepID=A0A5B7TQ14_9FLAO|nr:glycoside hydrolase family 18 protein [Aureibaculum algae]QCX38340.1 glycoside hydrolase family 18 protein [Aureibaculum algae]
MKYFRYFFYCSIFFVLVAFTLSKNRSNDTSDDPIAVIAYYVPQWYSIPKQLPLGQLTHIIYSFTKVIDGEMKFSNEGLAVKLQQLVAEKKNHPHLKVMIACGGWGADGFSDMAHTLENRKKFVSSAIQFIKKYKLDGLDIDWEYPGFAAANTGARPEDKQNFTLLMKQLREGLNTLENKQTLTFASAGFKYYYENIEIKEVMKYVDYMNVMTYDQTIATSTFTGHHTALGWINTEDLKDTPYGDFVDAKNEEMKKNGYSFQPNSAEMIIDYCIKNGVAPEQIVIGAAFYGRAWKGVPPTNNGLYQTNTGSYIGWSPYRQIRKEFESNGNYQRYWDSIAKAPYLYSAKDSIFISYDDTVSVKLKTEYAIKNNLGGIMFWELGNDTDDKNSLLKAIYDTSKKK